MNRKELQAIIDFAKKYDLMKHKFIDVYNTYKRSFIEGVIIN